ncbi:CHAT domain-containing protein [Streptomyces sp. NPDC005953]|uniref:CHAT domain-containing protein n=1 Tax=Streptomyces sp. NPDC005953 TaxID=3156719 RepID=UPI0033D5A398
MTELPAGLPPAPPHGALELATTLSVATRIEPELIRAVRLRLHPHLDVGAEADLWFCDWVDARTHDAIALLPECLPYLRGRLTRRLLADSRLKDVSTILAEHHAGLSPALFLEEQITWASLTGDTEEADRHLGRALHALVREQRNGIAGWFADAWQRLPETARESVTAWSLANATRAHVPTLALGPAPDVTLADVATIAPAVGRVRLGLRREGRNLLIGDVQGPDAVAILVPDTHPRMVEVLTNRSLPPVRIEAGAVVRVPVGRGVLNLRTGAGEIYRIERPGQAVDADAPVWEVLDNLLERSDPASPGLTWRLAEELGRLVERFHRTDGDQLLQEIVRLASRILQTGRAPLDAIELRVRIAETFYLYGLHFGDRESLDEAVRVASELPTESPRSHRISVVLGAALRERFAHSRYFRDLGRSEVALTHAVELTIGQHDGGSEALCELLRTLTVSLEADQTEVALNKARNLTSVAMRQIGTSSSLVELALAQLHLAVFTVTGEADELSRANALVTDFCAVPGWPEHVQAEALATRAAVTLHGLRRTGRRADLDAALADIRSALSLTPASRVRRALLRVQLANALRLRFHLLREHRDLTRAIKELQSVVKRRQMPSLWRAMSALNRCQLDDFAVTDDPATLSRAVDTAREAVASTDPQGDRTRWTLATTQLGKTLLVHYRSTRDLERLGEAIDTFEAAESQPPRLPAHVRAANSVGLATALHERDLSRAHNDLGRASRVLAAQFPVIGDSLDSWRAAVLKATTAERARRRNKKIPESLSDMDLLSQESAVPPLLRLRANLLRTALAIRLGDHEAALRSYESATHNVTTAVLLHDGDREEVVARWTRLAHEVAAYAIEDGKPRRALEYLEQQGSLLRLCNRGPDVMARLLKRVVPSLATELRWLWGLLHLDFNLDEPTRATPSPEFALRLDDLLESIRTVPEFKEVFHPLDSQQLFEVAAEGPVVVLNAADHRCDALLLTKRGLSVLPLVRLDLTSLTEQALRYTRAVTGPAGQSGHFTRTLGERAGHPDTRVVTEVLEWLWHNPVQQILRELQRPPRSDHSERTRHSGLSRERFDGLADLPAPDGELPRLWWRPTGLFTALPLHAAGHYDTSHPRTAMDFVVHSYTPGVQALIDARRSESQGSAPEPRMLLLADDTTPLVHTVREVQHIQDLVPDSTLLRGSEVAKKQVIEALATHPYFHFSGHASFERNQSALHINQERLTPQDLPDELAVKGALAYLSACDTHVSSLTGEGASWSIASAFQATGYRHVIATLGQFPDRIAADIALRFYRSLTHPDGTIHASLTARSLHQALSRLNPARPDSLLGRAAVIHLGP